MERYIGSNGVVRKLGFGEKSVWSSTPLLGEGLLNRLEGRIEAQPEPRAQSARESRTSLRLSGGWGLGRGSVSPSPEKIWNSYLKPCILVYSWSENLYFPPADLGIFRRWTRTRFQVSLHGSVVKPPVGSRMKPQLYTNDFDTFQSNAYFGVEESPFFKNMYVMVQINPHSEP